MGTLANLVCLKFSARLVPVRLMRPSRHTRSASATSLGGDVRSVLGQIHVVLHAAVLGHLAACPLRFGDAT